MATIYAATKGAIGTLTRTIVAQCARTSSRSTRRRRHHRLPRLRPCTLCQRPDHRCDRRRRPRRNPRSVASPRSQRHACRSECLAGRPVCNRVLCVIPTGGPKLIYDSRSSAAFTEALLAEVKRRSLRQLVPDERSAGELPSTPVARWLTRNQRQWSPAIAPLPSLAPARSDR